MGNSRIQVLMCCSDINTFKGGMVTVVKNYLNSDEWKKSDITFVATHIEGTRFEKSIYFFQACIHITYLLICGKIDVAHLHMAERGSFYRKAILEKLCHLFHVPVILHHHSAEFDDFYQKLSYKKRKFVKKILEGAELNLVLSSQLAEKYREKAPCAKIEVLYNAVKVQEMNPYSTDASAILLLGRLGQRKGTYDFLRALKKVRDEIPEETKCYLCGDGDLEQVNLLIKELGLEHRIAYVGWTDGKEKEVILQKAAIHILPSYREGLPMSILETMAKGIPNISTNIASVPEVIINEENGFLIEPGDINALADKILILLKNKKLRVHFSNTSFSMIHSKFTISKNIGALEEYYWMVLKKKNFEAKL